MSQFNAEHAWELGYGYAVRGILNMPKGTWLTKFKADFLAGHKAALNDGRWNTYA
jgi:hypothetical protein